MQVWKEYQQEHKDRFLNELLDLLRIPSVSARGEHKEDMIRCAEAVEKSLKEAGADTTAIYPTAFNKALLAFTNVARLGLPTSSSPSIRNFTLQCKLFVLTIVSNAFTCI